MVTRPCPRERRQRESGRHLCVGIASSLFRIEVETIMARVHARRYDLLDFFVGQLGGVEAPAHGLQLLQFLVLVRRDEIPRERAVALN